MPTTAKPNLTPTHILKVNRATNPEALLRAVLTLNRKRILSRLRHKHTTSSRKTKGRRPFLGRLRKATRLLRDSPVHKVQSQEIVDQVNELILQSEFLENMSAEQAGSGAADEHILHLIEDIDSFLRMHGSDLLVVPLRPGIWTKNETAALLDRMRKLSNYVKVCNDLLTAARRYPIFSNVTPCFVNLQQTRRGRVFDPSSSPRNTMSPKLLSPQTVLRVAERDHKKPADVTLSVAQRLGQESRLHAEIQLLMYYEQQSTALPPRIISSSKAACYLCKLFFEVHGRFAIPSSHGHLYDSWKWPAPVHLSHKANVGVTNLDYLLPKFTIAVEQKITECLEMKRKKNQGDCESRVSNGSFTATIMSTSSATSVFTIRASQPPGSLSRSALGRSKKELSTPSMKMSGSQQSRAVFSHPDTSELRNPDVPKRVEPPERGSKEGVAFKIPSSLVESTTQTAVYDSNYTRKTRTKMPSQTEMQPPVSKRKERHDSKGEDSWLPEERPQRRKGDHQDKSPAEGHHERYSKPLHTPTHNSRSKLLPIVLKKGLIGSYPMDTKNPALRLWTPALHLNLDFSTKSVSSTTPTEKRKSRLDIQWLDTASLHMTDSNTFLVDVNDIEVEKGMPESILFSPSGLIVRRRDTLIQLRVVSL